ncbi:MAG: hypothetical protein ACREFP_15455 [Acetobacteraceae bacterium]
MRWLFIERAFADAGYAGERFSEITSMVLQKSWGTGGTALVQRGCGDVAGAACGLPESFLG